MKAASTPSGNKIVVAVSGGGRSLANLLEAESRGCLFHVAGVIASRPDCPAVGIAREYGCPLYTEQFSGSSVASEPLWEWLLKIQPKLIVLAGFLRPFPTGFPGTELCPEIINIHPSLLPDFGGKGMYGLKVHQAVLDGGRHETGASVHRVTEVYDEGQIISQIRVPVRPSDTAVTLSARVFEAECHLLPLTVAGLLNKSLPLPEAMAWQINNPDIKTGVFHIEHGC